MTEIIAHRGARSLAPENTLAAARLAQSMGADRWETDASLTRDQQLVIFHDPVLTRCTNAADHFGFDPDDPRGRDRVDAYTLSELRELEAGSHLERKDPFGTRGQIEPAAFQAYREEKIPTLAEALELTLDLHWKINLELKDHHNDPEPYYTASMALAEIEKIGLSPDQITMSSFNHDWLRWIEKQQTGIEVQALVGDDDDVPMDFTDPVFSGDEFCVLNANAKLITPDTIRELRSRGKRINLFTVNDPADFKRFVDAGTDGIITDFPQRFIQK